MPLDLRMRDSIATTLTDIACEAGDILRRHHGGDCAHVIKPDGTPSSVADIASEKLIIEALKQRYPTIPIVSEESTHDLPPADLFFLVDPLDGTRDFLAGNPDYSVNICLIEGNRPVASAVAGPGIGRVWGAGVTAFEAVIHRGRPTGSECDPGPESTGGRARGPGQPPPRRHRDGGLSRRPSHRSEAGRGLGPEILPHRLGRGRYLCPLRPDHGVGHGRRGSCADHGRRQGRRALGARDHLWPLPHLLPQRPFRSPWGSELYQPSRTARSGAQPEYDPGRVTPRGPDRGARVSGSRRPP